MYKAQEYEKLQEQGMTIAEIAQQYGVSRQWVSQALINYRKPKKEKVGVRQIQYPAIKEWVQNNCYSVADFEERCGCCLRAGLMKGKNMRKFTIDAILRVTGLTYEQAFAK